MSQKKEGEGGGGSLLSPDLGGVIIFFSTREKGHPFTLPGENMMGGEEVQKKKQSTLLPSHKGIGES